MSDARSKLDALRGAFEKKTGSTGTGDQTWKLFYPFWKMPDDSVAVVRFLPDLDETNSLGFLVENLQHELVINGQRKKVPCLEMHGEDCPICSLSRRYYDEKNDEMGKKYYRKKSYVGQVMVIESPFDHDQTQLVKLIEFGPQVFKQIQAAFQSGDLESAPFELKGGYNFRFRKTKTGQGQNSYTTSNFAPKQTDLDDEIISQLTLFNLIDYRGEKIDRATVEAMLIADQTGSSLPSTPAPAPRPAAAAAPAATPAAETPAPAPAAETPAATPSEGGASSDGMSVLERLRAKAKQQAAANAS